MTCSGLLDTRETVWTRVKTILSKPNTARQMNFKLILSQTNKIILTKETLTTKEKSQITKALTTPSAILANLILSNFEFMACFSKMN
jgi:hypothetical protein